MIFLEAFLEASLVAFLEALVALDLEALEALVALVGLEALMAAVKRVLAIEEGGYITMTVKYDVSERGCYCVVG